MVKLTRKGSKMKKLLFVITCLSSLALSGNDEVTLVTHNGYEPLPREIPENFIPSQAIAAAREARENRKLVLRSQLADLTTRHYTLMAIIEATRRK